MPDVWGSGGVTLHILNLSSRVISFTSWPLYPEGKNSGAHSVRGCVGPRMSLGKEPAVLVEPHHLPCSLVIILIEQSYPLVMQ